MKRFIVVIFVFLGISGCSMWPLHSDWIVDEEEFSLVKGKGTVMMAHRFEPTDPNLNIDQAVNVALTHCRAYGYSNVKILEDYEFQCFVEYHVLTGEAYCQHHRTVRPFQCF